MEKNTNKDAKMWGYARVSTDDQNVTLQRDALVRHGVDSGNIFEEHRSGGTMDRPKWNILMKAAQPGDTIVIWRLDRLGRTVLGIIETIEDLKKRGVKVTSLMDNIDADSAMGEMLFIIAAAFAQLERRLISERTQAGVEAKRERGKVYGRPKLIEAFPKRLQAARDYIETHGEEAFSGMTDKQRMDLLNEADPDAPLIKHEKTVTRWRVGKYKGLDGVKE